MYLKTTVIKTQDSELEDDAIWLIKFNKKTKSPALAKLRGFSFKPNKANERLSSV